jgi:DHA1 family tetracycline resistance protein-like MFS transporter
VRRLGERGALRVGLAAGALGFAIYGVAPTPLAYWMGLPVFALTGLIQPGGVMGLMTRKVEGNEQGQLLGATSSIMGVTGLIGPGLFTTVFAWSIADAHMPGIAVLLAAVFMVAALAVTAKVGEA